MELIFAVFFLLFLYKLKLGVSDDFLSREYTEHIRGICAIIIVLSHIRRTDFVLLNVFEYVGGPVVGIFFFLSGYGIVTRIKQVGINNYMDGFLKKRILPLLLESVFIWLFYCICMLCVTQSFEFLSSTILSPHSWYIVAILVIYVLVYLGHKLFKSNIKAMIAFITSVDLIAVIVLSLLSVDQYWYKSLLCFAAGMIFSFAEVKKEKTMPVIIGFGILTVMFGGGEYLLKNTSLEVVRALLYNAFAVSFSIVVLNMGRYVKFKNPFFALCGKMSLEIYLLHGVFQYLFCEIDVVNNNDLLYGVVVIACTLLTSYAVVEAKKRILQNNKNRSS